MDAAMSPRKPFASHCPAFPPICVDLSRCFYLVES